jgi:hypothetical protein
MTKHNGLSKVVIGAAFVSVALGLTPTSGVARTLAVNKNDFQGPRVEGLQAPRGKDEQAPRDDDMQTPRGGVEREVTVIQTT